MPQPLTEVIVRLPDQTRHRYVLEPGEYLVGRDPSCQIRVDSPEVSRRHARLQLGEQDLRFEDLGSNNGSLIGGERLTGSIRLRLPQRIQLGSAVLEVKPLAPAQGAPSEAIGPRACPPPGGEESLLKPRNFQVGGVVAQGGMGAILNVRDANLDRTIAMKVMRMGKEASEESRLRFVQEARVLSRLEHPNIVPIYDLGIDPEGQLFYTMKFVKGRTLHEVIEGLRGRETGVLSEFSLSQLLTVFQKVCDAVAFAHSRGIIHRDLKPPNIMLGEYGEVLVMDWGLAKILPASAKGEVPSAKGEAGSAKSQDPAAGASPPEFARVFGSANARPDKSSGHAPPVPPVQASEKRPSQIEGLQESELPGAAELRTMEGKVMGTPNFMAPEQAEGRIGDIDARTDVFALGGILYNLLTLRAPAEGATAAEVMDKIKRGHIAPPIYYNQAGALEPDGSKRESPLVLAHCPGRRVPEALSAVAVKALAHDSAHRYQSVADLQQDIAAYQGGFATAAERAGLVRQVLLLLKRHKPLTVTSIILLSIIAAFMIKVIASERRARATLAELRKAAPLMRDEIATLIQQRKFEDALQRIGYVGSLFPEEADYPYQKGNMLQTLLRFREAVAAYSQALRLKQNYPHADENLKLCQEILREQPGVTGLNPDLALKLQAAMNRQGRSAEAISILRQWGRRSQELFESWKATLRRAGVSDQRLSTFSVGPDGLLTLDLRAAPVSELLALRGLPFKKLDLSSTGIQDLSALSGMPLQELAVADTAISELAPLRGMPLWSLDLGGTKVTDLVSLRGLPLKVLRLGRTAVGDLTPLRGLPLEVLTIDRTKIVELSPLEGSPLLQLDASESGLADLGPLRGMKLTRLDLSKTKVADLSPLKGMPLAGLFLYHTPITDFGAIKDMPLTDFDASELTGANQFDDAALSLLKGKPLASLRLSAALVRDISVLQGMPLHDLRLGATRVTNISVLAGMPLEYLSLPGTKVTDFSPIKGKRLTALLVSGTSFNDMRLLEGMPLTMLCVAGCRISELSVLRGMPLGLLEISGTQVSDLRPLEGMHLDTLYAAGTKVTDIRALKGQPLVTLDLRNTRVSDIAALQHSPLTEELSLSGTAVQDLAPLKGKRLKTLRLEGCDRLKDLSPLAECKELETLFIPRLYEGIDFLRRSPKLKSLSYGPSDLPVAEFWKAYDARKQ